MARMLITTGCLLIFAGVIVWLFGHFTGAGRLPGDIVIQKGNFTFYFPWMTSLLLSILLSFVLWALQRF